MKTATIKWIDDLQFLGTSASSHGIVLDAAREHGGSGTGASPMELVLEALGACSAMDVVSILRKKRQHVKGFSIELQGERAENHPRVYTKIHMVYRVAGPALSEKAVRDAVELSQNKYCSVSAMLRGSVALTYEIQLEGTA